MSGSDDGPAIIIFSFFSLAIGTLLKAISQRIKVPYTPILIVLGMFFGSVWDSDDDIGTAITIISEIDPHMILLLFIPALIFESSFSTDWHILRKELPQILTLAGPGVLVSTALSAVSIMVIMQYNDVFNWKEALMFGAILSATDPVAVVSLLKELGASKTLSTLIEGESLLNDGTAMVVFEVLLEMAEGKHVTFGHVAGFFARLSFGGPILGIIFAIFMSSWLGYLFNKPIMEVSVTFLVPYVLFYTAESSGLKVSGILALVALGLYMSGFGKTRISSESDHAVHAFWGLLGFVAETMIFLISGVIMGKRLLGSDSVVEIEGRDWGMMFVLYISLHVVRGLMVLLFYKILQRYGYSFDWRKGIVLTYSGLRGAVGLVLAMIVWDAHELDSKVRSKVLFHTAAIAFLTIMINGTTAGWVVRKVGLSRQSEGEKQMFEQMVKHMVVESHLHACNTLAKDRFLNAVNWEEVNKMIYVPGYEKVLVYDDHTANTTVMKKELSEIHTLLRLASTKKEEDPEESFSGSDLSDDALVEDARRRFISTLKGIYWENFENGQCGPEATLTLIESADRALDHCFSPMRDWDVIKEFTENKRMRRFLLVLAKMPLVSYFVRKYIYKRVVVYYDLAANFVSAHERSLAIIDSDFDFPPAILSAIHKEVDDNNRGANEFIRTAIDKEYPEILVAVQNIKAANAILKYQHRYVEHSYMIGSLTDQGYKKIKSAVEKRLKALGNLSPKLGTPDIKEMIEQIDFFRQHFTVEARNEMVNHEYSELLDKASEILAEGEECNNLYVVIKGDVLEKRRGREKHHYYGSIIGISHILSERPSFNTYVTNELSVVARIPMSVVRQHLNEKNTASLWRETAFIVILFEPEKFPVFGAITAHEDFLKKCIDGCPYYEAEYGSIVDCSEGIILLSGEVSAFNLKVDAASTVDSIKKRKKSKADKNPVAQLHKPISCVMKTEGVQMMAVRTCTYLDITSDMVYRIEDYLAKRSQFNRALENRMSVGGDAIQRRQGKRLSCVVRAELRRMKTEVDNTTSGSRRRSSITHSMSHEDQNALKNQGISEKDDTLTQVRRMMTVRKYSAVIEEKSDSEENGLTSSPSEISLEKFETGTLDADDMDNLIQMREHKKGSVTRGSLSMANGDEDEDEDNRA